MKKILILLILLSLIFNGSFVIAGKPDKSSKPSTEPQEIPQGAPWRDAALFRTAPPENYQALIVWMQAATMSPRDVNNNGLIVIDYIKIIEHLPSGVSSVVFVEDYNDPVGPGDGGLYPRGNRWFEEESGAEQKEKIEDWYTNEGYLYLDMSAYADNIPHWWTDRVAYTPGASYTAEINIKLHGPVAVQAGSDFWIDYTSDHNGFDRRCEGVNNCAYWVSDWVTVAGDEFTKIEVPIFSELRPMYR